MKIKKWLASLGLIGLFAVSTVSAKTDPEADRQAFVNYFENRHNGVEISNTIPKAARANPFEPLNGILGSQGERWAALNSKVP
ncbi:MAG: hypothetical protein ACPGYJ_09565, partial [bacterium]